MKSNVRIKRGAVNTLSVLIALASALGLSGCPSTSGGDAGPDIKAPPIDHLPSNAAPWELVSVDPASTHPYLGNGYFGFRTGALAGSDRSDGYCLIAGDYRFDAIQRRPNPALITLSTANGPVDATHADHYRQSLQMRDGTLTTTFDWRDGSSTVPVTITTFPSRDNPNLVVVHVSAPAATGWKVAHVLPAPAGPSAEFLIPGNRFAPTVCMEAVSVNGPGPGLDWTGYTEVYTSDSVPDPKAAAKKAASELNSGSYEKVLAAHVAAWRDLWKSDIQIDGDPASQQMVHAALFYLLESTRSDSHWSIPPMALSNDAWGGHIFWDAPMWIFPALALLHPAEARPMVDYSTRIFPAARMRDFRRMPGAAAYPWESGRSGREAAAALYSMERHVTGDVANMFWRYYLCTGDRAWLSTVGLPVLWSTAMDWVSRLRPGPDGRYHLRRIVGPDEDAGLVDDDAFSLGVATTNLQEAIRAAEIVGQPPPPIWKQALSGLKLPMDPKLHIPPAHSGYHGQVMKQADPELLVFPLELITDPSLIRRIMGYYPPRVSPFGPAMTDSMYAVIEARQDNPARALDYFKKSYEPFLVMPFDQISEKHSTVRQYCFVTGLGGLLQSVVNGFGGLEPREGHLEVRPHLPPTWKKLTFTAVRCGQHSYRITETPGRPALVQITG